jgi:hypothetical protein
MGWKKGESGNPKGPNKTKPFADALHVALAEEDPVTRVRKLRRIADKLVDAALAGEAWAVKEVMDRIDGKPAQTADVNVTADHTHTHVTEPVSETASWIESVLREREKGKASKPRAH